MFKAQVEYQHRMIALDNELQSVAQEFEKNKEFFTNKLQDKRRMIRKIDDVIERLQLKIDVVMKDQVTYYIDIIKKGFDVRKEGLSWATKKLMELNVPLDYSMFPRFLDHSQIDYIINLSTKQVEYMQLNIILKVLKNRQKNIREHNIDELFSKVATKVHRSRNQIDSMKSTSNSVMFKTVNTSKSNLSKNFTPDTARLLHKVIETNDSIEKQTYECKAEDVQVIQCVNNNRSNP